MADKKKNGEGDPKDTRTFTIKGKKYTIHPVAEMIPAMRDEEYEALKADIAENGIRQNVLVKGSQILDGIHRARAATEVGKPIPMTIFAGSEDKINSMIVSLNAVRRHLTDNQRVMLVAWARGPEIKEQAKARIAKGKKDEKDEAAPTGETPVIIANEADVSQIKARRALEITEFLPESEVKKVVTGKRKFSDASVEARKRKLKAQGKKPSVKKPKPEVDKLTPEYINKRFGMFLKHWPSHAHQRKVREHVREYLK